MNKYAYQRVPTMSMKNELIAWEALALAAERPEGMSDGEIVVEALLRTRDVCAEGKLDKRLAEFYIDKRGWTA